MKTKTIDVNTIRLSGRPVAYYDNSIKGGWDVRVVIDIGGGKTVKVSCPLNKEKKPYFTEEQFKRGQVSFIEAKFDSYINKRTNRPVFQIKSGGWRSTLLNTDIKMNQAFIAGVVNQANPKTQRCLIDIKYRKGLPKPGKAPEYGVRQVMVTCPDGVDLPDKGVEVAVSGALDVTDDGRVGLIADKVVEI